MKSYIKTKEFENGWAGQEVYLKKDGSIIGLHATGHLDGKKFVRLEAWANSYSCVKGKLKFSGSIYRIFGPLEDEVKELITCGWTILKRVSLEK